MATINHQDNFGTNLTTGTSAGDTTSPINLIPTIAAPFYVAFDATNINGNYEVRLITSKTATNILHAATSYDHTTAEEVRIVLPSAEIDTLAHVDNGVMAGGKIVVTVDSGNITLALKTIAGVDPSYTDPIIARIGDTEVAITTALSVTKNAATNWCNAGSAELATKEVDYFAYLGYNATDGVVIGFSRIPYANQYSEFNATNTNEKYCAISSITNAAATDDYAVIGRFAAILSAGTGYTWSVPVYTAINLIQRPIFETRELTSTVITTGFSGTPSTALNYVISNSFLKITRLDVTGTSNSTAHTATMPFASKYGQWLPARGLDNALNAASPNMAGIAAASKTITFYKDWTGALWTASGNKDVSKFTCNIQI